MKKYFICMLGVMVVLGFSGLASAAIVTDPTGDNVGPTDIRAIQAEQLTRADGKVLLKLSVTATPNLGGIVMFEADVDSSTGTGGNLSMVGIPVPQCPGNGGAGVCVGGCKTVKGTDVVIMTMNRMQGPQSSSGVCEGCLDGTVDIGKTRWPGEWYVTAIAAGTGGGAAGLLRGFTDPEPQISTQSVKCFTFPWDSVLAYARVGITNPAEKFDYTNAINPASTKWTVSLWTDPNYPSPDMDDFGDGSTCFNISDWAPNGNQVLVNGVDLGGPLTFCEGNLNGDVNVDGLDAAKFKEDFARSSFKNPCPTCNYWY